MVLVIFYLMYQRLLLLEEPFSGKKVRQMQVDKNNKAIIDKNKDNNNRTTSSFAQNIANIGASVASYPVVDAVSNSR